MNDARDPTHHKQPFLQFVTSSDVRIHVTCKHKIVGEDSDPQLMPPTVASLGRRHPVTSMTRSIAKVIGAYLGAIQTYVSFQSNESR